MDNERETCSKENCSRYAVMVMKFYTEKGPIFINSCMGHLLSMSSVIELIVSQMLSGEKNDE